MHRNGSELHENTCHVYKISLKYHCCKWHCLEFLELNCKEYIVIMPIYVNGSNGIDFVTWFGVLYQKSRNWFRIDKQYNI